MSRRGEHRAAVAMFEPVIAIKTRAYGERAAVGKRHPCGAEAEEALAGR